MDYFEYKGNQFFAEDVKILDITKRIKTPFYLYSKRTLLRHFHQIKDAFKEINPLICFAVKANANQMLLKILHKQGSGFDLVSGYELKKVLKAGADPQKIVYAGVAKTAEEISWAIKANILMFNCESTNEILTINRLAQQMNKTINIAIRINPDIVPETHRKITTGKKETKFGISIYEINKIISTLKKCSHINLKGLHFHIGSQITEISPFEQTVKKMLKIIEDLRKLKFSLEYLNVGGGLGIIYNKEKPSTPEQYAKRIIPLIKNKGLKLIMEPGRYIVGNAGILVTKVIYIKKSLNRTFVIVDAGMNTLIRPALYEAYHTICPLQKRNSTFKVDVVGPICETGDIFAKDRIISKVKEGEFITFKGAGAYGYVMSSTYNAFPLPKEVLVNGKKFKEV